MFATRTLARARSAGLPITRHARRFGVVIALLVAVHSVHASDAATDAMQAAYEPYRAALFRTNSKSQPESERAMASARAAWTRVLERFGANAPVPYDRDKGFADTLAAVDAIYTRAEAEIGRQQLAQAHETLEEVRDLLAALRQRNGVVTFSDHVNAYHEQMERVLKGAPGWLATPDGPIELTLEAGALDHLARHLGTEAGPAQRDHAAFAAALEEVRASSARLRAALRARDVAAARQALAELKPPFSRLFLRFG